MKSNMLEKIEKANEMRANGEKISKVLKKLKLGTASYYSHMAKVKKTLAKTKKPIPSAVTLKSGTETNADEVLPQSKKQVSLAHRVIHSNLPLEDKVTVLEMAYGL